MGSDLLLGCRLWVSYWIYFRCRELARGLGEKGVVNLSEIEHAIQKSMPIFFSLLFVLSHLKLLLGNCNLKIILDIDEEIEWFMTWGLTEYMLVCSWFKIDAERNFGRYYFFLFVFVLLDTHKLGKILVALSITQGNEKEKACFQLWRVNSVCKVDLNWSYLFRFSP